MKNQTICLFGGTGFVGRHLAARLANDGWRVRIPTRNKALYSELSVVPTISIEQGDIYNTEFLRQQTSDCAAVINLVGILNESGRDGSGFERAHVELTGKIVAACQENGVRRLLQMSALKASNEGPSHYLRTKAEAASIVRRAQDIDSTIFQPSVIFGADDSFINRFAFLLRLPLPVFPLPRANARLQPVFIKDVVDAFAKSIKNSDTHGTSLQLGGPVVYSMREIVELIKKSLGLRRHILPMPDALARIQAFVMDFVPGKPFSTDNYLSLTVNSICDSKGFETLGIKPASPDTLIPRILQRSNSRGRLDEYRRRHAT